MCSPKNQLQISDANIFTFERPLLQLIDDREFSVREMAGRNLSPFQRCRGMFGKLRTSKQ